ncbi:MAG: hypothetical protein E6Q88_11835 [Lysobacteraceae bacterium]|nr:MAG: hypothetical protein E6Q88_11835 [Xanthomonadaceae bacterium]
MLGLKLFMLLVQSKRLDLQHQRRAYQLVEKRISSAFFKSQVRFMPGPARGGSIVDALASSAQSSMAALASRFQQPAKEKR